jgi:hypothetical protein
VTARSIVSFAVGVEEQGDLAGRLAGNRTGAEERLVVGSSYPASSIL